MKIVSFRNDVLPLKNVLFRLALRITMNKEEAEDVVQDTLMKVWDRRDTLQDIDSIEAFSLTICRNIALDKTKRSSWREESTKTHWNLVPQAWLLPTSAPNSATCWRW